jgi:hypothetical protein
MSDREANFEQNLGRLLRASCGPEVDVTPAARERLHAEFALMVHRRLQPAEFPETALAFLTALILLPWIVWAACAWGGAGSLAARVLNGPILALIVLNLTSIPVAGLVIVLRRKYA